MPLETIQLTSYFHAFNCFFQEYFINRGVLVSFVDVLVCLVTMDAESLGPEALSEVQILEKRIPTALPATSKPQPAAVPGCY